jgi:hypothetical protein
VGGRFGWQTASTYMQEKHKKCVTSSYNLSIPGTGRMAMKKNPIMGSTKKINTVCFIYLNIQPYVREELNLK